MFLLRILSILLRILSIVHPYLLYEIKKKQKQRKGFEKKINKITSHQRKRKERDSNPRYEKLVQRISNPTL